MLKNIAFLNDDGHFREGHFIYTGVTPEMIGSEGLRFIHHLLLRREYGLPLNPRMSSVRGNWEQL